MVRGQGSSSVSNGVVRHNCRVAVQFSVEFWRSPGQACTLECWSSQISVVFPRITRSKENEAPISIPTFTFLPVSPRPSSPASRSLGLSRYPRLRFHSHTTHSLPWILPPPVHSSRFLNQSIQQTSILFVLVKVSSRRQPPSLLSNNLSHPSWGRPHSSLLRDTSAAAATTTTITNITTLTSSSALTHHCPLFRVCSLVLPVSPLTRNRNLNEYRSSRPILEETTTNNGNSA